jgi:SAM-dependent methyltransferase
MIIKEKINHYLMQLLSVFWLRPETALWRAFDCLLMDKVLIRGNSVDLGCGDGMLSYIMAGGKINNYDVFLDMGHIESYHKGADVFDSEPNIFTLDLDNINLRHNYTWGVDHKESLINKTNRFNDFYQNTLVLDLNKKLPFENNFFDTIFSNIIYWLDDLHLVLGEWKRVLSDSGTLILFVPDKIFREKAWLYHNAPHDGYRSYYNCLDRGYKLDDKHLYSFDKWETIFHKHGLKILKHVNYLTNPVLEIYNIGTRPIFPLLINMTNHLSSDDREIIKKQWVDYFFNIFRPIVEGEYQRVPGKNEYGFHFFLLKKEK